MWSLRCVYLLVAVLLVVTATPALKDDGYEFFDLVPESSYKLYGFQNWTTALETCERDGGHLVVINSVEEALVVKKLFHRIPREEFLGCLYVGFSDIGNTGLWGTIFGDAVSRTGYNNWGSGQPDNFDAYGEHCGAVDYDGALNDIPCRLLLPYVCERPAWKEQFPV